MENKKTSSAAGWIIVFLIIILIIIWAVRAHSTAVQPASATQTSDVSNVTLDASTTAADLQNAVVYSIFGNTFTLSNGNANTMGYSDASSTSQLIPIGYKYATSTIGNIIGTGTSGAVAALYRSYGADIEVPALFAFTPSGTQVDGQSNLTEVASLSLPVTMAEDASIQSVSIDQGTITLNLLVISAADQQNLPHYEQKPTQPLSLQYQIINGQFVPIQ